MTKAEDNVNIDLFDWAKRVDQHKNEFELDFFVFNKHFTPFRLNVDQGLLAQIKTLFLTEMSDFVNAGIEKGLEVKDFELEEKTKDIILRTDLKKVERASYLIDFLTNRNSEIVDFNHDEHEFKLVKGLIAKFTLKDAEKIVKEFFAIKQFVGSSAVSGAVAWQLNKSKIQKLTPDVALKVPVDNQTLIIQDQIFIFNQPKFERLFSYDYKKQLVAEKKIQQIEAKYQLSLPDGFDLRTMINDRKKTATKLQNLDSLDMTQAELIDYADDVQLELMTDDNGAIIILDGRDLDMFVGLLNEDFMKNSVTNKRYEIVRKKALGEPDGEPPRG